VGVEIQNNQLHIHNLLHNLSNKEMPLTANENLSSISWVADIVKESLDFKSIKLYSRYILNIKCELFNTS
jgi:hypothetical protein